MCAIGVARSCLRALAPRTPTAKSLNSFPDIADMKPEDYANSVSGLNADEAAAREYAKHNWTLAAIASAKFAAIGTATRFLRWMLVAAAVYACVAIAAAVPTAVRAAAAAIAKAATRSARRTLENRPAGAACSPRTRRDPSTASTGRSVAARAPRGTAGPCFSVWVRLATRVRAAPPPARRSTDRWAPRVEQVDEHASCCLPPHAISPSGACPDADLVKLAHQSPLAGVASIRFGARPQRSPGAFT